jgi:hypothetical protein
MALLWAIAAAIANGRSMRLLADRQALADGPAGIAVQ